MTERDHLKDNSKMYRQEKCGVVDWIDLAQVSDKRRAVVNTVMNVWFPLKAGNFSTEGLETLKKKKGLSSVELFLPNDTQRRPALSKF